MPEPFAIPVAHVGHYLWILYALPILIVVASIVRTTLAEHKRRRSAEDDRGDPPQL